MSFKKTAMMAYLTFAAILVSSCNLPQATNGAAEQTAQIETAVAQTVAVEGLPTNTPVEESTETAPETPNAGASETPAAAPSETPAPSLTPSETPLPCNMAEFVKDVTIPDGKVFPPGADFTKTWRLKNTGSCAWTSGYDIVFDGGDAMGAPSAAQLTAGTVNPGQVVDVSVNLKAPGSEGTYRGNWKLRDPSDVVFGLDNSSSGYFWVEIKVKAPTPEVTETTKEFSPASRGQVVQGDYINTSANNAGDTDADLGRQGFITFDISAIPDGATLLSAKLVRVDHDTLGDPFGSLGCLRAYVDNYGSLDLGDYQPTGVTGAFVRFCSEADLSDGSLQTMNSIGISGIESALASDTFQIRLQFKDAHSDNDGTADVVRAKFKLVVTYEN